MTVKTALPVILALSGIGGLAYVGLAPESKRELPPLREPAKPPEVKPESIHLPGPPVPPADLVPIRALLQPGLPPQVTLTVEQGLPGGLVLNAAPIGPYQGWAGFDAPRNCTHIVFRYQPGDTGHWIYGVVRGNGIPAALPTGCLMTLKLVQPGEPFQFPQRPLADWFNTNWTPPPFPPPAVLPLSGANLIPFGGVASPAPGGVLPYAGRVVVQ
jgi:hypothetical protein